MWVDRSIWKRMSFTLGPDCGRSHPLLEDPPVSTVHFISLRFAGAARSWLLFMCFYVNGHQERSHEGKHQRPTASKTSTMFHVVFCHRLESSCAHDDKSEHPSLKETSVQRPSQRNPAQTKAHTALTAHTRLEDLSAHFGTCLAAFFPPSVQEFQALTLKQRRRLVTRKLLNIKYSDHIGFFQGRQIDCMDPALARE